MDQIETINPANQQNSQEVKHQTAIHQAQEKKEQQGANVDPLLIAYMLIFDAVQIDRQSAGIAAKTLQANAVAQNNLINQEAKHVFATLSQSQEFKKVYFYTIHGVRITDTAAINCCSSRANREAGLHKHFSLKRKKVSMTTLSQLNDTNQNISAVRNILGDKLTVLKQDAQVNETQVNTVSNEDQQSVSQGSSLMNMLVSLSNQISRI